MVALLSNLHLFLDPPLLPIVCSPLEPGPLLSLLSLLSGLVCCHDELLGGVDGRLTDTRDFQDSTGSHRDLSRRDTTVGVDLRGGRVRAVRRRGGGGGAPSRSP
jgi:hypothetical protein